MTRNLLISGGIYHPFAETSASVAEHLATLGVVSEICDMREGLARLARERFDMVTINALAFTMTQAEKYAPLRAEFAFDCSDADKAALTDHLEAGGGLLGLHTASICFDTWPGWGDVLGARWVWGQSSHPMPDYLTVAHDGGVFRVWDELYCDMWIAPEARVLVTARLASGGEEQPIMTAKGRAVYLALGHDMTATANSDYAALLCQGARISLGQTEEAG